MSGQSTHPKSEALWTDETVHNFTSLLGISLDAINFWPPLYISSIFGKPLSWLPLNHYSEYTLLSPWRPARAVSTLLDVSIPALPVNPPLFWPPFLDGLFFRPTLVLHRPDHNQDYTTFPEEAWFFINGMMTNDSVAQLNAAYLSDLFHRPVTILQNTTQGFVIDLAECAFGKVWKGEWRDLKEASAKTFPPIYDALKSQDKKKVVVIAHSQGTIIISVVLGMLKAITRRAAPVPAAPEMAEEAFALGAPATPEFIFPYEGILEPDDFDPLSASELAKLEIYCFANCADSMTYYQNPGPTGKPVPWIENFGNEYDLVARLGMLAPNAQNRRIKIDGAIYMKRKAWGHLLNEHYLKGIDREQRIRLKKGGQGRKPVAPFIQVYPDPRLGLQTPRLYAYINGGTSEI